MLEASRVSLSLLGRPVLADVSVALRPGRITAILGPNGAGKSVLLSTLAGLRQPGSGAVTLDGQPLAALPPRARARAIGFLPQAAEIHWDVDGRTLVRLGRLPHAGRWGFSADDEAAVAAAVAATDTAALLDRPAQRLSGGEQARLLLARVLAGRPRYLLADEPLANLDPAHRLDLLARLRAVAAAGAAVALVLHDLSHAARIADDALVLRAGRVLAAGPAAEVLAPGPLEAAFDVTIWRATGPDGGPVLLPVEDRRRTPARPAAETAKAPGRPSAAGR